MAGLVDVFINDTVMWLMIVLNVVLSIMILWRISQMGHFETPSSDVFKK